MQAVKQSFVVFFVFLYTTQINSFEEYCKIPTNLFYAFRKTESDICVANAKHSKYLHSSLSTWRFSGYQLLASTFPIDHVTKNYVRQVRDAIFSSVKPVPLKTSPRLAAISDEVFAELLDLVPSISFSKQFVDFVAGNIVLPGSFPLSHRYGGHQFGYWAGQLGDGRAVMLGEYVNQRGERWELQLKGSGLTPYSRKGDGRAVIRSSVREFLCSEAMHNLGIPTSRAATLVVSDDQVIRDKFYDGNMKTENAAVVLRLAKSWFRIGSLEILSQEGEINLLRKLTDFVIVQYFPIVNSSDPDRYLAFFSEVVMQTADLIAAWQSVGFTHGVCNTDNFSLLSITIDYGPFGFLEGFDPKFVPNTSDDEGRYSYENQPDVGLFNLDKLRIALLPLLNENQSKQMYHILNGYANRYKYMFMKIFRKKLGLKIEDEADEQLVSSLLKMMEEVKADFTMTFREISEVSETEFFDIITKNEISENLWALRTLSTHKWFYDWLKVYLKRSSFEDYSDTQRREIMIKTNPRYILRNWVAQAAIEKAEKSDFTGIEMVLKVLKNPYDYSEVAEKAGFASPAPNWASSLRVSCSS
ncbi:hypothetical protein CHS0354_003705 [Potamilus streckersoni]|uniref:Selenoprotein O n=1 Tax=Potamilus streckersoni TaxID=2493646 RepID=A0AAE0SS84_9BIVA|nr:hypothetical protein CHS0354_003705 [Potamilus streckersoni]